MLLNVMGVDDEELGADASFGPSADA